MRRGCSSRLFMSIAVAVGGLTVVGFLLGGIGASCTGGEAFAAKPHPELPPEAMFHIGGFPVMNTMLAAWITTVVLVLLFWAGTRRMKIVPRGLQNVLEWVVEFLVDFVEGVAGKRMGRLFFPLVATIFLFVITNAWLNLVPGYGSIYGDIVVHEGEKVLVPLIRGANTDINLTLAIALVSFVFIEYMGIVHVGFFRYAGKFFNVRLLLRGLGQIFTGKIGRGMGNVFNGLIEAFVAFIEGVTEVMRIVSFTFRLFGNMTAGEILLLIMFFLFPFVIPVAFYGLELLIGFIQALVFAGLTLVFLVVATTKPEH